MLDKIEEMIENVKVTNVKLGKFLKIRNWELTGIKTPEGKDIYFCKQTKEFFVEEEPRCCFCHKILNDGDHENSCVRCE